jgi:hypothetical protein
LFLTFSENDSFPVPDHGVFESWHQFLIDRGFSTIKCFNSNLWPIHSYLETDYRSRWEFYRYGNFDVVFRVTVFVDLFCTAVFWVQYRHYKNSRAGWVVGKNRAEDTVYFFEAIRDPKLWPMLVSVAWAQPIVSLKLQEIEA